MTNYEKFKNEIEELEIDCYDQIAVLKQTGKPARCSSVQCNECLFCSNTDISKGCVKLLLEWAATEYKPRAEYSTIEILIRERDLASEEKKTSDLARRVVAEIREAAFNDVIELLGKEEKPQGFGEKLMAKLTKVYEENE